MKNTEKQATWWKYAAWTLPFVALAILIGEIIFGHDSLLQITSIAIVTTFITVSVFWWWWAISKIVVVVKANLSIAENFDKIKQELKEIKKDVGNR